MEVKTLNLEEAAKFCHCSEDTVRIKAESGEIPGAKIGRAWVFLDIDLVEHIRSKYAAKKEKLWQSRKEARTGRSTSALQVDQELENLLG